MWRKGYGGEHRAKQELINKFGKECVLKIAIAQIGADFMVIKEGRLILIVEVKETVKDKYYPQSKEKLQLERIKQFAILNNCEAELWIYYKKGVGRDTEKEIRKINEKKDTEFEKLKKEMEKTNKELQNFL